MSKLTTDLSVDELAEASDLLDETTRDRVIEGASTPELLELIRLQHTMQTDLTTAVAVLRAAKARGLH